MVFVADHVPASTVRDLGLNKLVDVSKLIFTARQRIWQRRDVQPSNMIISLSTETETQQANIIITTNTVNSIPKKADLSDTTAVKLFEKSLELLT